MTQHPLALVKAQDFRPPPGNLVRHPLDKLDAGRLARHLELFKPSAPGIEAVLNLARATIPGLAHPSVVKRVLEHNADCFWAIARKCPTQNKTAGEGFIAMLPLNDAGLRQLAANTFKGSDPDLTLVARPGEKPAGLYFWALFAPGSLAGGLALFMEKLSLPPYRDIDIFSRPNTDEGRRFNLACGLTKGATIHGAYAPHLYVFPRSRTSPEVPPLYDNHHTAIGARELSVTVARTLEDVMCVMCVRSAVYMAEQACPYEEEFDGNDFSATHLLGYVGSEPAGCLRIRYFADFAKIERLAVRHEFRHTRLSFQLVRAGFEFCRMKGYRRLYGHSQKRLLNFWGRFGFKPLDGRPEFVFSDFDYVEIVCDIECHPRTITIGSDPYVIIRPEGRWHVPGILEHSANRPATSPSVAQ